MNPARTLTTMLIPGLRFSRLLAAATAVVALAACGAEPSGPIRLDGQDSHREGAAQFKFDHWVVWCGHDHCDGQYQWSFPASGHFSFRWEVNHKCAGAPPYRLMKNGRVLVEGRVPQHGSCDACTGNNIRHNPDNAFREMKTIDLGVHRLRKGDALQLWVENSFLCGIENPGAYAAFREIVATPR